MLSEYRHGDWLALVSDRDGNARALFDRFLDGGAAAFGADCRTLKDGETGPVYAIDFAGKRYVLKHDLRKRHRFDYLVQSFVRGSNAFRLLRSLDAALAKTSGKNSTGRRACPAGTPPPVAEVFLVADRRRFRCVLESFVLMEFVEGEPVGRDPARVARFGSACADVVAWLHAHGMVHGDVNGENFLVTPAGTVRAIDLSGKKPSARKRAEDRIWLEALLGVKNEVRDSGWRLVRLKSAFREFSRRLRGKS